jgi:uncharacterized protein
VPKKPPVIVLDTNILISYFFGGATICTLIDSVENDSYVPALSPFLEQEFIATVSKQRISRRVAIDDALDFMKEWKNFTNYVVPRCRVTVCRDAADNEVLACALEASADYIVSGDNDLLALNIFHGIPIISPANFVKNVLNP